MAPSPFEQKNLPVRPGPEAEVGPLGRLTALGLILFARGRTSAFQARYWPLKMNCTFRRRPFSGAANSLYWLGTL